MYSENNSENLILQRMLNNVPSDVDKSEGSLIYDAIQPVSGELAESYINLDEVFNKVFAQNAEANGYSDYLEMRCAEFGIYRKSGTNASGQVIFTGSNGTVILAETIVQTVDGLQFKTTANTTIVNGTTTVYIQAFDIGSQYNLPTNTLVQLPIQITGVTSVINSSPIIGGTDDETDLALLQRLLLQVQTPSTSGNVAHYQQWGLAVSGIGAVSVFPTWNGTGTVKVCAVDSNMQPLSGTLLTNLNNYIESQRPIGATVTYESATALNINVTATITRNTAYSQAQIQSAFTTSLINYLKSIALKQNYVSYAVIGSLLLTTPGVNDYSGFTVNGGTANITIGSEQVATQGTVTINAA